MQSHTPDFLFNPNFSFGSDGVFTVHQDGEAAPFPPTPGNFELLDGSDFLLLDGTNFLLL